MNIWTMCSATRFQAMRQLLVSVSLLQRSFVAYVEVMKVSIWRSEEALRRFAENRPFFADLKTEYGSIQLDPRTYELVVSRDSEHQYE
jgi:heme-degrading monooxygenase HmoA